MSLHSTKNLNKETLEEIKNSLKNLDYGSIEIYVCNGEITQITKREIKKLNSNSNNHANKKSENGLKKLDKSFKNV